MSREMTAARMLSTWLWDRDAIPTNVAVVEAAFDTWQWNADQRTVGAVLVKLKHDGQPTDIITVMETIPMLADAYLDELPEGDRAAARAAILSVVPLVPTMLGTCPTEPLA
jgi:hypothetical protein